MREQRRREAELKLAEIRAKAAAELEAKQRFAQEIALRATAEQIAAAEQMRNDVGTSWRVPAVRRTAASCVCV